MTRPNWFLAFPIDGAFVRELPPLPSNFRMFHPSDVHLTLAFLGACGEQAATGAFLVLEERLARAPCAAFEISFSQVVPMGRPGLSYSALSALLTRGREEASVLIGSLRDLLTDAAGVARETRPPKPHVSVARPRRSASRSERQAGLQWASGLELGNVQRRIDQIALYTWSAARQERQFEIVATRPLAPTL